jgi:hypothetical protein
MLVETSGNLSDAVPLGTKPVGLIRCSVPDGTEVGADRFFYQHIVPNGTRGDAVRCRCRDARPCVSSAHRDDAVWHLIWITPCKPKAQLGVAQFSFPQPRSGLNYYAVLGGRGHDCTPSCASLARGYPYWTPYGVSAMRHRDALPCDFMHRDGRYDIVFVSKSSFETTLLYRKALKIAVHPSE